MQKLNLQYFILDSVIVIGSWLKLNCNFSGSAKLNKLLKEKWLDNLKELMDGWTKLILRHICLLF